jgi:hypothetical protein
VTVATVLRLEGAAVAAAAVALYADQGFSWLALVVLWLAPDLGAIGYVGGNRLGAITYDLTHFEGWPILLGTAGVLAGSELAVQLALVWFSHIGIDRAIGYGLKYPSAFRDTHLQRV